MEEKFLSSGSLGSISKDDDSLDSLDKFWDRTWRGLHEQISTVLRRVAILERISNVSRTKVEKNFVWLVLFVK